ncbi:glutathionyl-hydroquinone reductase [Malassezia sp. CBS 17886]|nr:glutathionyl-hydroquinone reductase [Malassezia sp. CBS 17886]
MTQKAPGSNPHFASADGRFRRQQSAFRDVIAKGSRFEPEVGRYKLIVALACPWAHRALLVRQLKRMNEVPDLLPVTVVSSLLGPDGWAFDPVDTDVVNVPGTGNNIPGHESFRFLRDFYLLADPAYERRPTVPVVWDNKLNTVVNNESSEIIRFLDTAFDEFLPADVRGITYYPADLRAEIDAFHEWVYPEINNGVYKSGFATTMDAYTENVIPLFHALARADRQLEGHEYCVGGRLTEADIRLWTTIVRFDPVYFGHFKCNMHEIRDGTYPHLHRWLRRLYWTNPAFKSTTDFDSIKAHYYASHVSINPTRIVPVGPDPAIEPLEK